MWWLPVVRAVSFPSKQAWSSILSRYDFFDLRAWILNPKPLNPKPSSKKALEVSRLGESLGSKP